MLGEHRYAFTSLLYVSAGQRAALKARNLAAQPSLDAGADSRKGAITLRRRRRSPSESPRGLGGAIVSLCFVYQTGFVSKCPYYGELLRLNARADAATL